MSRDTNRQDEPGVAEVRRWRSKLMKQGGGTIKGVMELLRSRQSQPLSVKRTQERQRKSA